MTAAPEQASANEGETILVVEDEGLVRMLMVQTLEDKGYRVIEAHEAQGAMQILESDMKIDLLATDVGLPGMNGRQLAQKVAELRRPLRVLYTSGHTFGAFDSSGRLGEGVLLLAKPYRKAELARMVRLCLDRAIDHMGDPIPLPYSVQEDLERFLKENPPKPG